MSSFAPRSVSDFVPQEIVSQLAALEIPSLPTFNILHPRNYPSPMTRVFSLTWATWVSVNPATISSCVVYLFSLTFSSYCRSFPPQGDGSPQRPQWLSGFSIKGRVSHDETLGPIITVVGEVLNLICVSEPLINLFFYRVKRFWG